jgi:hypothetical protein
MEKVIVVIHDGQVSLASQHFDVEVEVREYGVPDDWEGDIRTDDSGDKYLAHVFPAQEITDDQKCVGCEEPYSEDSINGGRCTNCGRMI